MKIFKESLLLFLLLLCLVSCNNKKTTSQKKPAASGQVPDSYYLQVPSGWTSELISFPIDFAPGINYKGMEDLRFSKGWGDVTSDEHWCYAFTWWLEGKPEISAASLQQNLNEYYTGLVQRNINKNSIRREMARPVVAAIKRTVTMPGDTATFSGTIDLLDYMAGSPIVLNCMIHLESCDTNNHTAVFFQISPRPFDHNVWKQLNTLNANFSCNN